MPRGPPARGQSSEGRGLRRPPRELRGVTERSPQPGRQTGGGRRHLSGPHAAAAPARRRPACPSSRPAAVTFPVTPPSRRCRLPPHSSDVATSIGSGPGRAGRAASAGGGRRRRRRPGGGGAAQARPGREGKAPPPLRRTAGLQLPACPAVPRDSPGGLSAPRPLGAVVPPRPRCGGRATRCSAPVRVVRRGRERGSVPPPSTGGGSLRPHARRARCLPHERRYRSYPVLRITRERAPGRRPLATYAGRSGEAGNTGATGTGPRPEGHRHAADGDPSAAWRRLAGRQCLLRPRGRRRPEASADRRGRRLTAASPNRAAPRANGRAGRRRAVPRRADDVRRPRVRPFLSCGRRRRQHEGVGHREWGPRRVRPASVSRGGPESGPGRWERGGEGSRRSRALSARPGGPPRPRTEASGQYGGGAPARRVRGDRHRPGRRAALPASRSSASPREPRGPRCGSSPPGPRAFVLRRAGRLSPRCPLRGRAVRSATHASIFRLPAAAGVQGGRALSAHAEMQDSSALPDADLRSEPRCRQVPVLVLRLSAEEDEKVVWRDCVLWPGGGWQSR